MIEDNFTCSLAFEFSEPAGNAAPLVIFLTLKKFLSLTERALRLGYDISASNIAIWLWICARIWEIEEKTHRFSWKSAAAPAWFPLTILEHYTACLAGTSIIVTGSPIEKLSGGKIQTQLVNSEKRLPIDIKKEFHYLRISYYHYDVMCLLGICPPPWPPPIF